MNDFHSGLLTQPSLLNSAIAPLTTDRSLYPTNDLQDPHMAELSLNHSSNIAVSIENTSVVAMTTALPPQRTFTVTSTADTIDANDGVLTLREAIVQANNIAGADIINFALSDGPQTITLTSGELNITDSLTINGLGSDRLTIRGGYHPSSIFNVADGIASNEIQVVINGLTITGSIRSGISNGGSLTVNNSTFTNNSASRGGGIFNIGTLTVNNSIFSGNSAPRGGGIFNEGILTVNNSTFSGNSATQGGGIHNGIYSSKDNVNVPLRVTVSNSTFIDNSATYGGGIVNYGGILTVSNSSFSDNSANDGGGIFNGIHSSMHRYAQGTLTVNNSTLSGNSVDHHGGGIYNEGVLTVISSTLSNNSATYGGGIANRGVAGTYNSIVGGNNALDQVSHEVKNYSLFSSHGYNLVGQNGNSGGFIPTMTDIVLQGGIETAIAPLAKNGGPMLIHALVAGSPALNAAAPYLQTDQRGIQRGQRPDIGAYENAPAIAQPDFVMVRRGTSVTIPVLANDFDLDGDSFSIVRYSHPSGGRVRLNLDGTLTYQTNSSFSLTDFFTYTISDGKGEISTAIVQLLFI